MTGCVLCRDLDLIKALNTTGTQWLTRDQAATELTRTFKVALTYAMEVLNRADAYGYHTKRRAEPRCHQKRGRVRGTERARFFGAAWRRGPGREDQEQCEMSGKVSAQELQSRHGEPGYLGPREEQDQCGFCGVWFTPGPDDIEGVCYAHRPAYSNDALWDAGYGEPE